MKRLSYTFNFSKLLPLSEIPQGYRPLIIFYCGSYNPIHNGHLLLVEKCIQWANDPDSLATPGKVVGAFLSPVHGNYPKNDLLSSQERLNLCEIAFKNHPLISIDSWEMLQENYQPTYLVIQHLAKECLNYYQQHHQGFYEASLISQIKFLFLCGADLFLSFFTPGCWSISHVNRIFSEFTVTVAERPGISLDSFKEQFPDPTMQWEDGEEILDIRKLSWHQITMPPCSIGSTQIRQHVRENKSIEGMVPDSCIPFVQKYYSEGGPLGS